MTCLSLFFAAIPTLAASFAEAADLEFDEAAKLRPIQPYENTWAQFGYQEGQRVPAPSPSISEVLETVTVDGRRCVKRVQTTTQQGLDIYGEILLDAKTFEPVLIHREMKGLPPSAQLPEGMSAYTRWEFDGMDYTRVTKNSSGDLVKVERKLAAPMFEGGTLGLLIARLPLKRGYHTEIPVVMSLGFSPDLVKYRLVVRVTGTKEYLAHGKELRPWVVEVDWLDWDSKEVTSPGGEGESGGAYYVLTHPPKGVPYVLRYANNSVLIDYALFESGG